MRDDIYYQTFRMHLLSGASETWPEGPALGCLVGDVVVSGIERTGLGAMCPQLPSV